jgi:hypothetical protein
MYCHPAQHKKKNTQKRRTGEKGRREKVEGTNSSMNPVQQEKTKIIDHKRKTDVSW